MNIPFARLVGAAFLWAHRGAAQAADFPPGTDDSAVDTVTVTAVPTLGETLNHELGMSSTSFGAGASRPLIRGLDGERVRVLESGIGAMDASSLSDDHAVSVDPLIARQLEVLKGPATLLYGSGAIDSIVNVVTGRIPATARRAAPAVVEQ